MVGALNVSLGATRVCVLGCPCVCACPKCHQVPVCPQDVSPRVSRVSPGVHVPLECAPSGVPSVPSCPRVPSGVRVSPGFVSLGVCVSLGCTPSVPRCPFVPTMCPWVSLHPWDVSPQASVCPHLCPRDVSRAVPDRPQAWVAPGGGGDTPKSPRQVASGTERAIFNPKTLPRHPKPPLPGVRIPGNAEGDRRPPKERGHPKPRPLCGPAWRWFWGSGSFGCLFFFF